MEGAALDASAGWRTPNKLLRVYSWAMSSFPRRVNDGRLGAGSVLTSCTSENLVENVYLKKQKMQTVSYLVHSTGGAAYHFLAR